MKQFVFRNYTVEMLFGQEIKFSGYGNVQNFDDSADAYFWFYLFPEKADPRLLSDELKSYIQQLHFVIKQIAEEKEIFLFTMTPLRYFAWENGDRDVDLSVQEYNDSLYQIAGTRKGVFVVDFSEFVRMPHAVPLIDWKYYYISQMLINPALAGSFNSWLNKKIQAVHSVRKKCIILDLDNTLWGGVLGEEGIQGIQLGNTYPGIIYWEFQQLLLQASKTGIILAVVSKNNEQDVLEAWQKHPSMVLKQDHFSATRINWINKTDNIISLVKELNIGMDSCLFIDDNPAERALVSAMIPTLTVPEFPAKLYDLPAFFKKLYQEYFQIYRLTEEDRKKTEQYKANAMRKQLESNTTSFEDYLAALETEAAISECNQINIARLAQLTQKTNQFNLTTRRYSESDLNGFLNSGYRIFCLSVKDKFGDNGITGLIIYQLSGDTAIIDSFLLSCRILGRNIEKVFLKETMNMLFKKGIRKFMATYYPTAKNAQVATFYDTMGFSCIIDIESGKEYLFEMRDILDLQKYIKIAYNAG